MEKLLGLWKWMHKQYSRLLQEKARKRLGHYCRMLLTRHYDQRPFDEIVCNALTANGDVKTVKMMQNVCDGGYIKQGSDFRCVCIVGHRVDPYELFAMR